jgi:hypothetical protein
VLNYTQQAQSGNKPDEPKQSKQAESPDDWEASNEIHPMTAKVVPPVGRVGPPGPKLRQEDYRQGDEKTGWGSPLEVVIPDREHNIGNR